MFDDHSGTSNLGSPRNFILSSWTGSHKSGPTCDWWWVGGGGAVLVPGDASEKVSFLDSVVDLGAPIWRGSDFRGPLAQLCREVTLAVAWNVSSGTPSSSNHILSGYQTRLEQSIRGNICDLRQRFIEICWWVRNSRGLECRSSPTTRRFAYRYVVLCIWLSGKCGDMFSKM